MEVIGKRTGSEGDCGMADWIRKTMCRLLAAGILCSMLFLTACGRGNGDTKIVLTTGFGKDEVFRIEGISCTVPEIMVYLTNTQNQYEAVYGEQIWQASLDGVTLAENIKETVLAGIAQIKTLNLMAQEKGVTLSKDEQDRVVLAANTYFSSLNERETELLGVSRDTIEQLYGEYALAQKLYAGIIKDINPEISDDEARIITVQHILFKTYTTDGSGKRVEYTDAARAAALERAKEVLSLATDGEHSFESLIEQYSEDSAASYSFGKGEMTEAFEKAAFELSQYEISEIVEDEYGYHILRCTSTFDREETDRNKQTIIEERKKEVFGQEYDVFVDTLTRKLNDPVWEEISLLHDEAVTTADFFEVYREYFPDVTVFELEETEG